MKTKWRAPIANGLLCLFIALAVTATSHAAAEASVHFIKLGGKGNATLVKSVSGSTASYGLVETGTS